MFSKGNSKGKVNCFKEACSFIPSTTLQETIMKGMGLEIATGMLYGVLLLAFAGGITLTMAIEISRLSCNEKKALETGHVNDLWKGQ